MSSSFPAQESFQYAVANLPYYKSIVAERGIDATAIVDKESFEAVVPILKKEDIFPRFDVADLCTESQLSEMSSAIVTSGTSGSFAFGLVTKAAQVQQQKMLDQLLRQLFHTDEHPPIIINALPMGVSFVSEYPVVPVSTRTDIAMEIVKRFGPSRQVILITDPRLLHKMLLDGQQSGVQWETYQISAIIGGMWFPDSYVQQVLSLLNGGEVAPGTVPKNMVVTTMGITEVGLNIFAGTPDMMLLRSSLQRSPETVQQLFGAAHACPTLAYCMADDVYPEILTPDERGVGELVLTHLTPEAAPMLVRYNTGDRVQFLDESILQSLGFEPRLPLPVVAIHGRSSMKVVRHISVNDVQQLLFADPVIASATTGNFVLREEGEQAVVLYQLRSGCDELNEQEIDGVLFRAVLYQVFEQNQGVQYEYKWTY